MAKIDQIEGGFFDPVSPLPGVGKLTLLPKLKDSLKKLPFLLCGPPGSGKKNLLKIATQESGLEMSIYDLGHIAKGFKREDDNVKARYREVEKIIGKYVGGRRLQTNLMGERRLLVFYGAEFLDRESAALLCKCDVVLLANERTANLKSTFGNKAVWVKRLTHGEMKHSLKVLYPEAGAQDIQKVTRLANGDLRQAQMGIDFKTGPIDEDRHVYFDVQGVLCRGVKKNLDYHHRRWVCENHLKVDKTIAEHAAFLEHVLLADAIQDYESPHTAPACIGDTADCVASFAAKRLVGYKRVYFDLECPPEKEGEQRVRLPPPSHKFPTCSEDLHEYSLIKPPPALLDPVPVMAANVPDQTHEHSDSPVNHDRQPRKRKRVTVFKEDASTVVPAVTRQEPTLLETSSSSSSAIQEVAPLGRPQADQDVHQEAERGRGNILLSLKSCVVSSVPPFAHSNNDAQESTAMPTCGPKLDTTRSRSEVIVQCPEIDLKAAYSKLKKQGVEGIIVSKFCDGVAALIVKHKNQNIGFHGVVRALETGRRTNETVQKHFKSFASAVCVYGDMKVKKKKETTEMPDFEEACEQLASADSATFRILRANAKKNKKYDRATPLEEGILTYTQELNEWLACKEDAESMIFDMSKPGPHFINNFKKDTVLNLRGVHFETSSGVQTTTLRNAISQPQAPGKPPLLYSKTIIFVGKPSTGKTELVHGLSRECCQRRNKDKYGHGSSIDPYGLMTKSGKIKELGAIGLSDFELKSKINNRLSIEEIKGLLYIKERAHIGARYHQAVFYEYVPRFWAVNTGKNEDGQDDPTEWFRNEHLHGLVKVIEEDTEGLRSSSGHDQAVARRAVIFIVDESLYEEGAQGATDAAATAVWEQDKQNGTPLD